MEWHEFFSDRLSQATQTWQTRLLRGMYPPAATLPFGPLWFLGFYLVVVCVAPVTIRLHRRFPPLPARGARSPPLPSPW